MREEVRAFAELMEQRLKENDHKPGWKNDTPISLARRIREEYLELLDALAPDDDDSGVGDPTNFSGDVLGECADVANFAMMVADVTGALRIPPVSAGDESGAA